MDTIVTREDYVAAIDQWENHLIDREIALADARADLHRAFEAFNEAIRERDRTRAHLCHLRDCSRLEAA